MKRFIVLLAIFLFGMERAYAGQFLKIGSMYVNKNNISYVKAWNAPLNSFGGKYNISIRFSGGSGGTYKQISYPTAQERDKEFRRIEKWLGEK